MTGYRTGRLLSLNYRLQRHIRWELPCFTFTEKEPAECTKIVQKAKAFVNMGTELVHLEQGQLQGLLTSFLMIGSGTHEITLNIAPGFLDAVTQEFHEILRTLNRTKWRV